LHHAVYGDILTTTLKPTQEVETLKGDEIVITRGKTAAGVEQVHAETSLVTTADIIASNGVVDIVDHVLLPSAGPTPAPPGPTPKPKIPTPNAPTPAAGGKCTELPKFKISEPDISFYKGIVDLGTCCTLCIDFAGPGVCSAYTVNATGCGLKESSGGITPDSGSTSGVAPVTPTPPPTPAPHPQPSPPPTSAVPTWTRGEAGVSCTQACEANGQKCIEGMWPTTEKQALKYFRAAGMHCQDMADDDDGYYAGPKERSDGGCEWGAHKSLHATRCPQRDTRDDGWERVCPCVPNGPTPPPPPTPPTPPTPAAPIWIEGKRGKSCTTACKALGRLCVEGNWPTSRAQAYQYFKSVGVDCQGGLGDDDAGDYGGPFYYANGGVCEWGAHKSPHAQRCGRPTSDYFERICPCKTLPPGL
jgi:hypothetical protein